MPRKVTELQKRAAAIELELAEMKRRYIVEGIEAPMSKRVTLEAELADIRVKRLDEKEGAMRAETDRAFAVKRSMLQILSEKLASMGLSHIVEEARQQAQQEQAP